MANVTISQLPAAGAITGSELVPIVQNGVTVHTTTGAIAASPSQTQTFLTLNQEPTLPNSRALSGGTGVGLVDGGAQSTLQITLNGASGSLESMGVGLVAKTASNAVTARQIAVGGTGLAVTNANGVSGNPTLSLDGLILAMAQVTGTGLLAYQNGATAGGVQIIGSSNQISVANGNGSGGNPTISIADNAILPGTGSVTVPNGTSLQEPVGSAGMVRYDTTLARFRGFQNGSWVTFGVGDGTVTSISGTGNQITVVNPTTTPTISLATNPVIPGTASMTLPIGSTAQRPFGSNGMMRYNSDLGLFEGYINGSWQTLAAGSGVTSVGTGTGLLGGPITSTGTIDIDTTIVATLTGTQTLINKTISGSSNTLSDIANASLTNSSVTYNGVTVALGASGTITATTTNALTVSTGLQLNSGTTFDGSAARTISIDSTVATLSGTQTLTNKTIDGGNNTLQNIPNSSLTNSQITLGTTNIALGGTSLAPAGLTSVTVTQNPTADYQLATKQYVDNLVATGTTYHTPVKYEVPDTTGNLTATYNNGTAGVGATLTNAGTLGAFTPDGVVASVGDRVLIYNQTSALQNGVYTVTVVGNGSTAWVLTRATDADSFGPGADALDEGSTFFVTSGNTGAGETYTCNTSGTITFGTTAITFAQIGYTQIYSAGTGLTLNNTTFSISNTAVTANTYGSASQVPVFTVNAQGQLTLVTNTSIAIAASQITSGTIDTARISGSYTGITGVGTLTAGTWNASTIGVGYGGTGLTSYSTGDLLYASGSTTLAKLTIGSANYVLTSSGSAPQYVAQSTLAVGTATNLAGGIASQIPYQTGAGATSFIANGTAGQVLTSAGTGAPTWSGISGGTF